MFGNTENQSISSLSFWKRIFGTRYIFDCIDDIFCYEFHVYTTNNSLQNFYPGINQLHIFDIIVICCYLYCYFDNFFFVGVFVLSDSALSTYAAISYKKTECFAIFALMNLHEVKLVIVISKISPVQIYRI